LDKELLTHIIDIKETLGGHTEAIDNMKESIDAHNAECPVWEIETRVTKLETDKRWYSKIVAFVGGVAGAGFILFGEWFLGRHK